MNAIAPLSAAPGSAVPERRPSDREAELLRLLAAGLECGQAALVMGVSEATVRAHLNHLYARLEVPNLPAAIAEAAKHGLLASPRRRPIPPQRLRVLEMLAQGLSNPQIAQRMCVAEPTVRRHVSLLLRDLGARTRGQAVAVGIRAGLLVLRPEGEALRWRVG